MSNATSANFAAGKQYAATLVRSERITPPTSTEDVRHLVFRRDDLSFSCKTGQCVRVMAPGQYGNKYHPRLYLVADNDAERDGGIEFAICVKRHSYIDDFNGERYQGIASNYLCDLPVGAAVEFTGPFGYPFEVPASRKSGILMIGMGTGIAPFRALIRTIYEKFGSWDGKVRLLRRQNRPRDALHERRKQGSGAIRLSADLQGVSGDQPASAVRRAGGYRQGAGAECRRGLGNDAKRRYPRLFRRRQ